MKREVKSVMGGSTLTSSACQKTKPRNLGDWRPISLLSTIQKFYNAVTAKMYDDWIELPMWMAGFMEGRQTLELSFSIQRAFEKSMVLGKGCWVAKLDVRKAFDNMDHPEFASLCTHYGIHPSLILSTLREWKGARTTIDVSGFGSNIKMLAGGRQGGRDTPKLWNILLFLILKEQVEEWEEESLVWSLQPRDGLAPRLHILARADDMIIFANSKSDLTKKLTDILERLRSHRLDVKPDSLEWTCTANHHFGDRGEIEITHLTGSVKFMFKPKGLNILGVWLDPSNNNESIWKHRLIEAQLAWLGLKDQLCRRRIPLRDRILRWQATVGKTLLWGCGAWTMTKDEFLKIQSFQLRCFRHMWGRRARLDELWSHACIRLKHNIKMSLKKWNVELVADTAMKMYHSWAGHAARLPKEHFLHDLLRYRSLTNEGLRCVWGRPKDWNVRLKDHHGSEWWLLASDRETWKRCGGDFVKGRCEDFGVVEPDTRGKDSGPTWKAGFFNLLGNPVLGSFRDRTLAMIGTRERTIQLVLGKGTPCQANRTIVKRLQQGHFLITETQQFRCQGNDSCFMIIKTNKMMHLIADASARTGVDMKQLFCIEPREGDTVMAYWDFTKVIGQAALGCAVFLNFPDGGIELVCLQTRKVEIVDDEEGDLMALRMVQDLLLHSQGISLKPARGLMMI